MQISLQAIAYSANTEAGHTVSRVLRDSDIPPVFATVDDGALKICDKPTNASTCRTIASVAVPVDINQTELRFSFNDVVPFRRDVNVRTNGCKPNNANFSIRYQNSVFSVSRL